MNEIKIKFETDATETIKTFDILIKKLERMLELKKEINKLDEHD